MIFSVPILREVIQVLNLEVPLYGGVPHVARCGGDPPQRYALLRVEEFLVCLAREGEPGWCCVGQQRAYVRLVHA